MRKTSLILQAATPAGESGAGRKSRTFPYVYKCRDCDTERKVADHDHAPKYCSYCGSKNVSFEGNE
jgi:Zn finger protein HypA/HybF involved in hydrogenase expression